MYLFFWKYFKKKKRKESTRGDPGDLDARCLNLWMDTFHVVNAVPSKSNEQIETSNLAIGRSRSLEEDPGEKRGKRRGTSPIMRVHWEEGGSVALSAQASFLIRIFWVKSSRRGKISLSHFLSLVGSVLLEVWGYKGWKRGEIASCFVRGRPVSWPSGAPCRGNPLEPCAPHNSFGRVLSTSCRLFFRILLPFFHSPADSLSARADKLDPEKIFSPRIL